MADNPEYPGAEEPHPVAPSGGDFPADFFDDAAEPSPVSVNPEPVHHVQTHPHPTSSSYVPPRPPAEAPPGRPIFPVFMGIVFGGALVAAWFVSKQPKEEPAAPAASTAAAPAAAPEGTPAAAPAPATSEAVTGEVKEIKTNVEALAAQVKGLQEKVDGLPKPAPEPDLKPIQGKVDELAKSVAAVVPLTEKIGKIDERLSALDGSLKSVKDDLGELSGEVKKRAEAPAAKPAEVAAADDTATTMSQGAELFKAGKYKEAADVFKKLESANVKDARVYYYSALLKGLNTGNWQGETVTTGEKGAELEKAGSPKPADVDAAFADLPANLKPWLAFFRKKAK